MTCSLGICVLAVVHLILRCHIFVQPNLQVRRPGPEFPAVFVCLACLDIIYDNRLYPKSCRILHDYCLFVVELAVGLFLLEVCMLVLWPNIEHFIGIVLNNILVGTDLVDLGQYDTYEELVNGLVTVPLSIFILGLAGQATDHFHIIHQRCCIVQTHAALKLDGALRYWRRSEQKQNELVRDACLHYEAANGLGRRRGAKRWVAHFDKPDTRKAA